MVDRRNLWTKRKGVYYPYPSIKSPVDVLRESIYQIRARFKLISSRSQSIFMKFFRKIRRIFLQQERLKKYLLYALGEIVLVVIGIVMAVQINEGVKKRQAQQAEIENYDLILSDLKGDLELFETYKEYGEQMLDAYYRMNDIAHGKGTFENLFPDFIVMNVAFDPVTQENHQSNIEKMSNKKIRAQLVSYFRSIDQARKASGEIDTYLKDVSRPFFLKEKEIFKNSEVFNPTDRGFPPYRGVSVVDTIKFRAAMNTPEFLPILSAQRMSLGFYLAAVDTSIKDIEALISFLEENIE